MFIRIRSVVGVVCLSLYFIFAIFRTRSGDYSLVITIKIIILSILSYGHDLVMGSKRDTLFTNVLLLCNAMF